MKPSIQLHKKKYHLPTLELRLSKNIFSPSGLFSEQSFWIAVLNPKPEIILPAKTKILKILFFRYPPDAKYMQQIIELKSQGKK